MGRRRRECCFAKGVGCPILASLFERSEGWLQVGSTSFVIATRHEQPCPCTVAICSPLVPRCDQPATVPRPPKMCRTVRRRHSSRPVVPPSRAAWRRLTVRMWLDRRLIGNAPADAFARKPSGGEETPAPAKSAPTAPLRSGGCHGFCFHPRPEKSVRRPTRPVKKESLRVPPKAVFTSLRRLLIAGRLERELV